MELKLRTCDIYTKHSRGNDMGQVSLYVKHIKSPKAVLPDYNTEKSISTKYLFRVFFFFDVSTQIDHIVNGLIGCQEDRNQQEDTEPFKIFWAFQMQVLVGQLGINFRPATH